MALKVEEVPFADNMPNHPQLKELFMLVAYGDPVFFAEGSDNGTPYLIVAGGDSSSQFTFTKSGDGYVVAKTRWGKNSLKPTPLCGSA
ncbi:TPA: hypothetical protein QEK88_003860 [Stenotrophomonas maltophilia]|nr:hypothetical protein [Stenotrophomonas maltophilia]